MSFSCVTSEGNLIPADLLEQIATGEAKAQLPADFGLDKSRRLTDEIATAWGDARAYWEAFRRRLLRLKEQDPGTSDTRQYWVTPLLESLGYTVTFMPTASVVNNHTYAISHRAGKDENFPPIHIEGFRRSLDQRPESGRPRLSPHALMQEYLNNTEHLWGIVTNGRQLRLLRDSSRTTRLTFVEFDLQAMLEGEKFSEFALFYRLLHRTRLPEGMDDAPKCLLEQYHQQALEAGGRVREGLRDGVETALRELGNGFLRHSANSALREAVASGKLSALDYYRELLRLVYRLLFLMVAEERKLIGGSEQSLKLYMAHYSVARLRKLVEQSSVGRGRYGDLWLGLLTTFRLLQDEQGAGALGITALDGDLFGAEASPHLENTQLLNEQLVKAVRALSLYRDSQTKALRRVNYSALDVEELGSVYESLLDFRPVIGNYELGIMNDERGKGSDEKSASVKHNSSLIIQRFSFDLVTGTERKTTGSYYTRPELVHELIKSALEPVLEERLKSAGADRAKREQAILDITVCDPACGSGHFLLAAARRLGRELAQVRSGEDQPNPEQFRRAVRDTITRCVYGVDLNPLAVDLCKLALWLEGHNSGMPLSFLDSHIRCGNSLVGASDALVKQGIPDEAYTAVTGDNKAVASAFKKRNKQERELYLKHEMVQSSLFERSKETGTLDTLAGFALRLEKMPDEAVAQVRAKKEEYERLHGKGTQWWDKLTTYNLWTAAFFTKLEKSDDLRIPTTNDIFQPSTRHGLAIQGAYGLAQELRFFHWELEFPHIFAQRVNDERGRGRGNDERGIMNDERGNQNSSFRSGFDVVLGNPPWERIKLQEQEHWVDDPYISKAANKAEREKRIKEYRESPDKLKIARVAKFDAAKYQAEAESRFIRASCRFPLTAVGDVNTYALFAEQARNLLHPYGRAGVIVPTGIATDDTTKAFFGDLIEKQSLARIIGFENEAFIFSDVHHAFKFCAFTISGSTSKIESTDFAFLIRYFEEIEEPIRHFILSKKEIEKINPNTKTCPIFRTKVDAELTKKIYSRVPVLINERTGENAWGVSFLRMLDMSNDSHLFHSMPGVGLLPLYEAKLLHQFTHRWGTYDGISEEELRKGLVRNFSSEELQNPDCVITPRYWVAKKEVETRLKDKWKKEWLLGFRDVTSSVVERTAIFSFLPKVGVGHTMPIVFIGEKTEIVKICCFLSTINSISLDYITRQKVGGIHLTYGYLNQLAVLPPSAFSPADVVFISERVLELVYTAWDMQPFAEDVWQELDAAGRERVLRRNDECRIMNDERGRGNDGRGIMNDERETPNSSFIPHNSSFPLPPFLWNEERRAHIRAELDARIARLYGLTRDELRYILDPQDVYGADFPGETFRVLKEKEIKLYGEYRTRRLVLEKWDGEEQGKA
ncbi:MAG: N-6 DNA methylase [Chloroflexi bacterium]|uniref:site-specific DNA-methyltransferase (adenine-specific) n=1 Tax=Candidatus Chlorohelix allophototropha TaxID=3003348 RepID=A0A8T7M3U6_9CHLR|nr:N-6 DNA methylase [Chloroflexota bacterium]WJW69987.1 N-6 DNA methylase [Chloroflexota bacterium L227-S17]